MGVEVDTVLIDLEARIGAYRRDMREAIDLQREFQGGWGTPANDTGPAQTARAAKQASGEAAMAAEQASERVVRAKRSETDASIAADNRATESARRAAKEQADAAIAEAEREAAAKTRISEMVDRSLAEQQQRRTRRSATAPSAPAEAAEINQTAAATERLAAAEERIKTAQAAVGRAGGVVNLQRGESISLNAANTQANNTSPAALAAANAELAEARRERDAAQAALEAERSRPISQPVGDIARARQQTEQMRQTRVPGDAGADVEAEREVDRLRRDEIITQSRINSLVGEERREQQDILAALRLERQLRAQNVSEAEILVALDEQAVRQEARRTAQLAEQTALQRRQAAQGVERFAAAAGLGRGGGAAVIGGLAAGAAAGAVYEAAKAGLEYAASLKAISEQIGITTKDLQVYQTAAERVGVSTEQLRTAFGQAAGNLGRAQEGAEEQGRVFSRLGIDIGNAKSGYLAFGEVLPKIVEKLSNTKNGAQRAAIETALFGEEGRKLDGVLSGGVDQVNNLADALEKTGGILSGEDIARSAKVAADLKALGDQLERQLASTVSQNAQAIETLATSLLNGASALLKFIDAFQRFRAQNQIGIGTPEMVAAGRSTLNGSDVGRQQLLKQNSDALRTLRGGANSSDALLYVGNGLGSGLFGSGYIANTPEGREKARKALLAQRRETIEAQQRANALNNPALPAPTSGGDNIFAPKPPKPRKGRSGPSPEQIQADIDAQNERLDAEILEAKADLSETADDRAKAANQRLDAERASYARQLANDDKIDSATADALLAKKDQAIAAERQKIQQERLNQKTNEDFAIADQASSAQIELLQAQAGLAKTAQARRELQDKLLAAENDRDAAQVNNQINTATTDQQRAVAAQSLADLPSRQKARADQLAEDQKGPLARYFDTLKDPKTQVEQAVADKLRAVDDSITDAASKVLGVKDPFLKSLLQVFLEQNVLQPLYASFSKAGGGVGGLGGLLGSLGGLFGGGGSAIKNPTVDLSGIVVPGLATGGTIGGIGGVDKNLLSINGSPVAKVGRGEMLTVTPNAVATNQRVSSAPAVTVVAPQHFDLSGAVMTPDLVKQINASNKAYTDAVGRTAYTRAVQTAAGQAPGVIRQGQVLKG